ncbi:putative Rap/Ran GTPase-activating protein [Balamuthia mandrillaris]
MARIVHPSVGYRIEGGGRDLEDEECGGGASSSASEKYIDEVFDLADNDVRFYKENFLDQGPHMTYLCKDSDIGPAALSVIFDEEEKEYVGMSRTCRGTQRIRVPSSKVKVAWWRKLFHLGPSTADVVRAVDSTLPASRMKLCSNPNVTDRLLEIEEKQSIKGFKFGILYAQEGQTKEEEMFANVDTSEEFEEFLDFIGDRVQLNGWSNFRAGLDVRNGTTGTHGLYIKWNNNEIMYHVSTMLPYNPLDKQQLERKRHIGNDIVVIVWQDGDTVYRPTTISSRQVHVAFVIKAVVMEDEPEETYYRMAVVSKDGVPPFGPEMDPDAVFKKGEEFKEFFYTKLLNAEKASYDAPILENKLTRTRTALLKDLAETFL